jgi:glucose/mannose-6-phosphate isomerase
MTLDDIKQIDHSDMYSLLAGFPTQVREALSIANASAIRLPVWTIRNIVVCGLGGSAIGGDLLRSYLAGELQVPLLVNRHYTLPKFVGPQSLVIVSSYSGNTEETTAAHREAIKRKARIFCISSGGLTAALARKRKTPLITIPGGLPPRTALGYSFFPLLVTLSRLGFIRNKKRDIAETLSLLDAKAALYGNPESPTNTAYRLALLLQNRLGVVYTSTDRFDAVGVRWRGQIAENGKALSFGHVLPEMNHNELVGWRVLEPQMREMQVFFLRDKEDYLRVKIRMDITKEIISRYTPHITEVWSEGNSPLARIFSLITLGDWMSFYLAMLHRVDPTPVEVIDHLKTELGKVKEK